MFTEKELEDYVLKNSNCKFLNSYYREYNGKKRRILILLCSCNNEFEVVLDKFKRSNKKTCKKCSTKERVLKNTKEINIQDLENYRNNRCENKVKILSVEKRLVSGTKRNFVNFEYINIPEVESEVFSMRIDRFKSGKDKLRKSWDNKIKKINNNKKTTEEFKEEVDSIRGKGRFDILSDYNGTNEPILVRNNICGHEFMTEARGLISSKQINCTICNMSKLEENIENELTILGIKFKKQYKFSDCKNKRPLPFDFYLPEYNICIEADGIQHYKPVKVFGGLDGYVKTKCNDYIKTNYCDNENIKLIRVSYFCKNIKNILIEKIKI